MCMSVNYLLISTAILRRIKNKPPGEVCGQDVLDINAGGVILLLMSVTTSYYYQEKSISSFSFFWLSFFYPFLSLFGDNKVERAIWSLWGEGGSLKYLLSN